MTHEQWFKLPLELRQRWWKETDYGKREASKELWTEVFDVIYPGLPKMG